jgi:hypothetical protein
VAAGDVRGECERPEADCVAVLEPVVHARGGEPPDAEEAERTVGGTVPCTSLRHDVGVAFTDPELCAGGLLQLAKAACVVGVRVGVEQYLHVPDVEAELRYAPLDERRGLGVAAVDEDVALGTGDQEGGDAGGADIIEVAGDAKRFVGNGAVAADGGTPLQEEEGEERDEGAEEDAAPVLAKVSWHAGGGGFGEARSKTFTPQSIPRFHLTPHAVGLSFACTVTVFTWQLPISTRTPVVVQVA